MGSAEPGLGVNTRRRLELIDAIEINMAGGRGLLVLLAIIGSAIGEGFTFNFEEYSDEVEESGQDDIVLEKTTTTTPAPSLRYSDTCEPCQSVECTSLFECLAGVVPDRCGCCQVCARQEGELCDPGKEQRYGTCGDNLDCKHFPETAESICVCRETKEVCGSDGLTYGSPCELNEESVRRDASPKLPKLSMTYWGPCKEAPAIISPPVDSYGPTGANLTLDCEARGFPAPTISWQYDNVEGRTILLPSDDQDISIQMRGGPEPLMVTGWAQILALDPTYSGTYHCIASNSEGKVYARAQVGVYGKEEL